MLGIVSVAMAVTAAFSVPLDATDAPTIEAHAQTQQLTEIKIGALLEFSQSYDDTDSLRAMELSIQDINNDPAISSQYNVTLVQLDITGMDSTAIGGTVLQAVQTRGIQHFVGYSSSTVVPAKLTLEDPQIAPLVPGSAIVSYGSSAPIIPLPNGVVNLVAEDSLFRLIPSDTHQAASVVDLILGSEGKTKGVIVVRQSWEPIVQFLIPPEAADAFQDLIPYTEAERFAGDVSAAISSHGAVARTVSATVERLVEAEGADNVALIFVGFPLDFEYHVKGVLASGGSLEILRDIKWYSTATTTGEAEAVRDSDVAEFAEDVRLTGTRYTVLDNPVNMELCMRMQQLGATCNQYEYSPFAAYDAVHLLVDAIITQDLDIDGSGSLARDLILDVASGRGVHHLVYEGRTIGDGALGEYTLNAVGDLEEPSTYTVLRSTTDPANPWIPAQPKMCR